MQIHLPHLLVIGFCIFIISGCNQNTQVTTQNNTTDNGVSIPSRIIAAEIPTGTMRAYLYMDQDAAPLASKLIDYSNGQTTVLFENIKVSPGEHTFTISFKFQSSSIDLIILAKASTGILNLQEGSSTSIDFSVENYSFPDKDGDTITNIDELERGSNPIVANRAPTFTVANTSFSLDENLTEVSIITATDLDNDTLLFALSGGEDQALFTINAQTNALSFISAPDYDIPQDNGKDNIYHVNISVNDGVLIDQLSLTVRINNVIDIIPLLSVSGALIPFIELPTGTLYAYLYMDQEVIPLTSKPIDYSNGQTAVLFENIPVPPGEHTFTISFKFQSSSIDLIILARASTDIQNYQEGSSTSIDLLETDYYYPDDDNDNMTNITELERGSNPIVENRAPTFTVANTSFSIDENTSIVTTVTGIDLDGDSIQFSLAGGEDLALFSIDAQTNALSFISAPDFENPQDNDNDNIYHVGVNVSDGVLSDQLSLAVKVANIIESPISPILSISGALKRLKLSWSPSNDVTHYNVLENADGSSGFTPIASNLLELSYSDQIAVHLVDWVNKSYMVEACNSVACVTSNTMSITNLIIDSIGYVKASNTEANDYFGYFVALSADGNTLAVGAQLEDSSATGINGNQTDNTATSSGAVYLFTRNVNTWQQQAYVKASNTQANNFFGESIALSADGNTLAVGATGEDSSATGINGDQTDNTATGSGAVYLFTRNVNTWQQQAYIKASNTSANDFFGDSVALSADGNTLVVGAFREASSATGINGDQTDNTAGASGAVYLFTRNVNTWQQQAYIKASNTGSGDDFGDPVALSADGNTLAVGAIREDSSATGINGDQTDNMAGQSGAVYLFARNVNTWQQQAYIKASNSEADDYFGASVALSADGNTLAVGAAFDGHQAGEDSSATGINGSQTDNTAPSSGAVYLFTRNVNTWQQQAYIKASNTDADDYFGDTVALSADGNTLVVGAFREASSATGINGDQTDNTAFASGAIYLFTRNVNTWQQHTYIKASNTGVGDDFGDAVALSADGNTLAVGATGEGSSATGINGNQAGSGAGGAGAVYLY